MLSKSTLTELLEGKPSKKAIAEVIADAFQNVIRQESEVTVRNEGIPHNLPFEIGKCYYFRTVTHHQTGRVKAIIGKFVVLEDGAWIPDSGRWKQAIETGKLDEVEPVDVEIYVNSDSLIDAYEWIHSLPRTQL
jgi:hypothetical protein